MGPLTHDDAVVAASFSPDGSRIVTASEDKTARLWDVGTGAPLTRPLEHQGPVLAAFFSPDHVVTGSLDEVRIWDPRTGDAVGTPLKHLDRVVAASFSPDATRIVTACRDGTARVWDTLMFCERDAEVLADLAETVGGLTVSDSGSVIAVASPGRRLAQILEDAAVEGERQPDVLAVSFARWVLADPWTRTISPLSGMSAPEYICNAIRHGTTLEAQRAFPGHLLLRGHVSADSLPSGCEGLDG